MFFIALNTYHTQQTMTLDVLNSLHKSLGTCPSTNVLADDPQKLKVELMPHQKHAIAWLMWRESQKPRGGILGILITYIMYSKQFLNININFCKIFQLMIWV